MRHLPVFLFLVVACGVQLPPGEVDDIARTTCAIGHPLATYRGARVGGGSALGCGGLGTGFTLDITYKSPTRKAEDTMVVRYRVTSFEPCEVTAEVVSDSGPAPILLDIDGVGAAVGADVCRALGR